MPEVSEASDIAADEQNADERDLQRHAGFLPVIVAALTDLAASLQSAEALQTEIRAHESQAPQQGRRRQEPSRDQTASDTGPESLPEDALDFVALLSLAATVKPKFEYQQAGWLPPSASALPKCNLFNELISNTAQVEQLGLAHDMPVLIPAYCKFMLGDISTIRNLFAGEPAAL